MIRASAVRRGPWKLIYHHADRGLELFDIDADIGETRDLSKEQPARAGELAKLLGDRLRAADAQMPTDRVTGKPIEWPDRTASAVLKVPESSLARALVWRGVALEEDHYTVWGVSPVFAEGRFHLFAARWPEANVDPAWRRSSEIAHDVAEKPEGPFRFQELVLRGTGRTGDWDAFAPHNPEIQRFGDRFALCYIANSDFHQPPHPLNQ